MKIAVCIKRVPVREVKFAITADGSRVDDAGLKYDVNDFDLWAIEAALQLKEKHGNVGEVAVISLGPDAAQEQIRKALAMGADRGVLLKADHIPADGLAVARALGEPSDDPDADLATAADVRDGGHGAATEDADMAEARDAGSVPKVEVTSTKVDDDDDDQEEAGASVSDEY